MGFSRQLYSFSIATLITELLNLAAQNDIHLLDLSFYGSGVWVWYNWVLCLGSQSVRVRWAMFLSEAQHPLPSSCGCWQNLLPSCSIFEVLGSSKLLTVPCHIIATTYLWSVGESLSLSPIC